MKAAIVLSLHGSIEELHKKMGGNLKLLPEFLVIKKFSERFEKIFLFSHDRKSFQGYLPENCMHVKLYNKFVYFLFGWLVVLIYTVRFDMRVLYVEGGPALPQIFLVNKLTRAAAILDYPYLWHGSVNGLKKALIKKVEDFLLNFIDLIAVGNKEVYEFIKEKEKIMDVGVGVNLNKFDPSTKPANIFQKIEGKSIIFTGRLTEVKDPLTLIKAYKIAKRKVPHLSLIICGDGELRNACKEMADSDMFIEGIVYDLPSYLAGADIFVLPSKYDASPRSLIEAMAMKLPCIATNVGGVPEILGNSGIVVDPENPQTIAEKILYLLEHPSESKELGENARKRVEKYYNLERTIDKELQMAMKGAKK